LKEVREMIDVIGDNIKIIVRMGMGVSYGCVSMVEEFV
jgi:accessory colonization factor AcfC